MTVFHLNFQFDDELVRDVDGQAFRSIADARRAAVVFLQEIAADHVRCGTWNSVKGVEIATVDGVSLQYVTSEEAVPTTPKRA